MARFRRESPEGSLQHVISRFVNREFLLGNDVLRAEYLRRLARSLGESDWKPITFALMSSHVHVALIAGAAPASSWMKPLHTGFAGAINRQQGRLGPVFAERPKSISLAMERAALLVAYLHNNPVRGGVVRDPVDSTWTAHRAFVGETRPPHWLDVPRALALCGFDSSKSGRLAFHDFVRSCSEDARNPELSGCELSSARAAARRQTGAPVEICSEDSREERPSVGILLTAHSRVQPRWAGSGAALLSAVAELTGVTVEEIQSRERKRERVAARRLVVAAGRRLGWTTRELGALVSIGGPAARHLVHRKVEDPRGLAENAERVAAYCWEKVPK